MLSPIIASLLTKTKAILRLVWVQMLFVYAAFAIMVITTYIFVSDIERANLRHSVEEALSYSGSNITSYLLEPETALNTVAETLRGMLILGFSQDMLQGYITDITQYMLHSQRILTDVSGFYGSFDIYEGKYLNGMNWTPPPGYDARERPWYKSAIEAKGRVGFTDPYLNLVEHKISVTHSRQIFDMEGNSLGVVGIDITLNRIRRYAAETRATEGSYGVLLDRDFKIIAHPDEETWGNSMMDIYDEGVNIVDKLLAGAPVAEHRICDYLGRDALIFIRQISNGWYLGIVAPESVYYKSVKQIAFLLGMIGLGLSTILNIILMRISAQKYKADSESKQKSNFLAMMSHEIRTPMNAILGIAEIQIQNKSLSQGTAEALNKIYNSGYSLLGIINDILDFSKIEAGKLELIIGKYDVASLIHDTTQLNIMRIGSKLIKFNLQVDPFTPAELVGDELRIKQILNNLLSNAFKYTDSGEVVLSVTTKREDRVREPFVSLIFHVSDTGQGMSKEQMDKLFDEYSRFQERANRAIEGTGLGMNITKRLVDLMLGTISVDSTPGKGTTFTVCLPQGISDNNVLGTEVAENLRKFRFNLISQKAAQIVREPMPYGKVLIVDDVETNIYVAKGLMSPYDLAIDTTMSGYGAIEKIKEDNVYDIIFMDHMMPRMDGIEATGILREMGYQNPIVALTANAVSGQAEMFLEKGFDDFISKPIDIRQLNAILNKLIRDKQPPEVIEAAHAEKKKSIERAVKKARPAMDPALADIFIRDAEKSIKLLENLYAKENTLSDDDIQLYVINTHAMKSALANIGEIELADVALMLEAAGRERDISAIITETPAFLNGLRAVIKKISPAENNNAAEEDAKFLHEKLLLFRAACTVYDKKAAKDALNELKEKTWTRTTGEMINGLAEHLLHSDFEEASNLARDYEING